MCLNRLAQNPVLSRLCDEPLELVSRWRAAKNIGSDCLVTWGSDSRFAPNPKTEHTHRGALVLGGGKVQARRRQCALLRVFGVASPFFVRGVGFPSWQTAASTTPHASTTLLFGACSCGAGSACILACVNMSSRRRFEGSSTLGYSFSFDASAERCVPLNGSWEIDIISPFSSTRHNLFGREQIVPASSQVEGTVYPVQPVSSSARECIVAASPPSADTPARDGLPLRRAFSLDPTTAFCARHLPDSSACHSVQSCRLNTRLTRHSPRHGTNPQIGCNCAREPRFCIAKRGVRDSARTGP